MGEGNAPVFAGPAGRKSPVPEIVLASPRSIGWEPPVSCFIMMNGAKSSGRPRSRLGAVEESPGSRGQGAG